ncbi:MAG: hypothetical protein FJ267_08875, partial [Planctomycetes bacterium]|nr:hypothetical protein [Planctomycetota bacterium]
MNSHSYSQSNATRRISSRTATTIGIAIACGALAMVGMMARYSSSTRPLLPGMDEFDGQLAWSIGLAFLLIVMAAIVRPVDARRIQMAVACSLTFHLFLCTYIQKIAIRTQMNAVVQASDLPDPGVEMTLPDYAGMEVPDADSPWQEAPEVSPPEAEIEIERKESQLDEPEKLSLTEIERTREEAKLIEPNRQEQVPIQM